MWNFIKNIYYFGRAVPEELTEVDEEEILNSLKDDSEDLPAVELNDFEKEEKEGVVTQVNGNLAVIDDVYFFNFSETVYLVNDKVKFTVFFNSLKTVVENVEKVTDCTEEKKEDPISGKSITRVSGQIFNRDTRVFEVNVEESNSRIHFSLNNVKSDFVPSLGDFVDLEVLDFSPDVSAASGIKVLSVRPKKTSLKLGVVTSRDEKYGTISNFAIFTSSDCEPGFSPGVGSKVCASLIRSDCINGYKWRAIQVIPQDNIHHSSSRDAQKLQEEFRNKRGIAISICPKFTVNLSEQLEFKIEVLNKSPSEKLMSLFPLSKSIHNQVQLLTPVSSEISIKSGDVVEFHFKISGKYVGKSYEDFVWDFKEFFIRRRVLFDVVSDQIMPESKNDFVTFDNHFNKRISARNIIQKHEGDIMPALRNKKSSVFIPVKVSSYPLPKTLIEKALPENVQNFDEVRLEIEKYFPFLKAGLNPETYGNYMHALLYLEEVDMQKRIATLDIENASFRKYLDYLILDVPQHSFYVKNLMPGDYVLVSVPWDNNIKMQGVIHKITKAELWLVFSKVFHSEYREGTCYFTSFVTSRSAMRRKHQAIDVAVKHLGYEWLFPRGVTPKPPQITFKTVDEGITVFSPEISMESTTVVPENQSPISSYMGRGRGKVFRGKGTKWNCSGSGYGRTISTKEYIPEISSETTLIDKILWFNSLLNIQQKEAVIRTLAGLARPLPYVIFGPPGTGKTVTVVEAILQVHKLLPRSRILVGTPTNSAADLIAQHLMEWGNLQEGDFLRLVGHNYAEQGRLTSSLIPYSATPSFQTKNEPSDQSDIPGYTREQISQHRIIVSTVSTLGQLYCMGFPRGYFTHIFIDEAGQADEPEILVAMTFLSPDTGQVILSGDPLQLGPVILSRLARTYGLKDSFLLRMLNRFPFVKDQQAFASNFGFDPRLVTKLINNYRSMDGILQIFNSLFYDGDLVPKVSNDSSEEAALLKKLKSFDLNLPVIFHGLRGSCVQERDSKSVYNPQEVFQVFCYLNKLYFDGVHPDEIGIITPYQLQALKIQELLESHGLEAPKIGSVEEFQGQERMVIILSVVRSEENSNDILNSNFVTDPCRVNVALSRARALLIIVGDPELLSNDKNWYKIIKYCEVNDSYVGCQLPFKLKHKPPSSGQENHSKA